MAYNLRKIKALEIAPLPGINLFWGENGSGKTTLLEAIHFLHAGKSFRTNRFNELVSHGEQQFGVRGDVAFLIDPIERPRSFKIEKTRQSTHIEVDGSSVTSASVLAKSLPLLIVEPSSFGIVEGGPRIRRSLIDRASFHVEPDFLKNTRGYSYALHQRNQLLKTRAQVKQLFFWNEELARYGEALTVSRNRCVAALNEVFAAGTPIDDIVGNIQLKYRQGWKETLSLSEAIRQNQSQELVAGTTSAGPHKAEIEIQAGGSGLARIASRGQIKIVVLMMISALVDYIYKMAGYRPVVLVDDFSAELDGFMRQMALNLLSQTKAQLFLTSIDDCVTITNGLNIEGRFHVEQGQVGPLSPSNQFSQLGK